MAYLDEMNIGGTDYTIQDKRVTTQAVSTATHLLATNSGVTSIAPITVANAAAVLGGVVTSLTSTNDLDNIEKAGVYSWSGTADAPSNYYVPQGSLLLVWKTGNQIFQLQWPNTYITAGLGLRIKWNGDWYNWKKIAITSVG